MISAPYESWFGRQEVVAWRRRLRAAYKTATFRYLRVAAPRLARGTTEYREAAVQAGRSGREAPPLSESRRPTTRRRLQRLQANRAAVAKALDALLTKRPIQSIGVRDVLKESRLGSSTFYAAFRTGLAGAYCHWATEQLDELREITAIRIASDLDEGAAIDQVLRHWSDLVATFILQKPYGRLSIISFLVRELDSIGASLSADAEEAAGDDKEELESKVDEFATLASSLHRAGARLIHQLAVAFEELGTVGGNGLAASLWPDRSTAAWNMAVSFWRTVLTDLLAVGILEAEREASNLRTFAIETWRVGAEPRLRQPPRDLA